MTDIVKELRQASLNQGDYRWEAADEIERLRAALREIVRLDDEWVPEAQDDYTYMGYQLCADVARAALEGK